VLAAVAAAVALLVWAGLDRWAQRHGFFDLRIYRGALRWWLDGGTLYGYVQPRTGGLGFTYPPFAALVLTPLAAVGFDAAAAAVSVGTAAAVTLTTWWFVGPLADRYGWPRWFAVAVAVPLVCALEPVRETMGFGQVNLLLVALVLADLGALRRGARFAGVGIGLAAAVKLTPAFFVLYLLVTGRGRAAGVAVGTAAAATVLAAAVAPAASWQFWGEALWRTSRVGRYDYTGNQSWMGLLARLTDPHPPSRLLWLAGAAAIAGYGLWRARRAWRAGDDLAGLTVAGLAAGLVSPISWTHHLYWVVPALVLLLAAAAERRALAPAVLAAVTWAAFAGSLIWPFNHRPGEHLADGALGVLGENAYVLLCLVLLAAVPARRSPQGVPELGRVHARPGVRAGGAVGVEAGGGVEPAGALVRGEDPEPDRRQPALAEPVQRAAEERPAGAGPPVVRVDVQRVHLTGGAVPGDRRGGLLLPVRAERGEAADRAVRHRDQRLHHAAELDEQRAAPGQVLLDVESAEEPGREHPGVPGLPAAHPHAGDRGQVRRHGRPDDDVTHAPTVTR
jgi:alpha-1,2-mannosyltransferase